MKEITEGEAREALEILSIGDGRNMTWSEADDLLSTLITRYFEMEKAFKKGIE